MPSSLPPSPSLSLPALFVMSLLSLVSHCSRTCLSSVSVLICPSGHPSNSHLSSILLRVALSLLFLCVCFTAHDPAVHNAASKSLFCCFSSPSSRSFSATKANPHDPHARRARWAKQLRLFISRRVSSPSLLLVLSHSERGSRLPPASHPIGLKSPRVPLKIGPASSQSTHPCLGSKPLCDSFVRFFSLLCNYSPWRSRHRS